MDAASRYQFPTTLTHQRRFCGLTIDEVVVYFPLIGCAIFVNMWIFAPALAIAFVGLRRLKQGKGSSYLLGLAYWCLPTSIMRFFITVLPESFKRYWIA